MRNVVWLGLLVLGSVWPGRPVHAQDRPSVARSWFARVAGLGAFYHSSAQFLANGQLLPGASAVVTDNATVTLDLGRDITDHVSALLMVGVPPKPLINARGTVAALGQFGKVRYGPVILTGRYSVRRWGALRPYTGTGVAYAIILKNHDGAVSELDVHNHFGFVLQGGVEYGVGRSWAVFADFKQLWLAVNARGLLAGGVPIKAHVILNPSLVSAGAMVRFRWSGLPSDHRQHERGQQQ